MSNTESCIFFCGDLFVGREISGGEASRLFRFAGDAPVLVNLEGSLKLSDAKARFGKACPLELHASLADSLPSNVHVSLANNHSLDFGRRSYLHTRERFARNLVRHERSEDVFLDGVPIRFLADLREECKPVRIDCYPFSRSVSRTPAVVKDAVLYVHGGIEYRKYPSYLQRNIAHELIDAGARAVIFQHSHIKGVFEAYGGGLICYGLGNFFFSSVNGRHGEDRIDGQVLRYDRVPGSWSVAVITPEYLGGNGDLQFEPVEAGFLETLPDDYKAFYKARYPLDRSLRPRQLDRSEWLTNLKFLVWLRLSKLLILTGLSGRVKSLIGKVSKRPS
ncbi:MAG: CapA family protein [Pseudomonadota bacterium]